MIGRVDIGLGLPEHPGTYAVELYCGWKLLDWSAEKGWYLSGVCTWKADLPVQWVGPLPACRYGVKPKMEFDL